MESTKSVREALARFHRVSLADVPTRLEKLENLSQQLAPYNIYVKRDDQTGLAFGGNKARKLDFIMADVLRQGCDCIVTWAGVQSNWCRSVAAAASRLGIKTKLVLFKGPKSPEGVDGNLLLDRIFDAEILVTDAGDIGNMLEVEIIAVNVPARQLDLALVRLPGRRTRSADKDEDASRRQGKAKDRPKGKPKKQTGKKPTRRPSPKGPRRGRRRG
jgi:1-aminocyclopropane-1-carboxylate deaminase/D-cysteine desulfhydrase-like pyridoxal-dependent ACC family enzyme